ncbi:MAG: FAD-dependent monooxygenase [Ardenticatenaceae bacterium]|nr:FAD-dependent monooxygenase [Ardenticatenaceae bacterium]
MSNNHLHAIVMGGSLGGLNAALYLREAGFDVTVLERSRVPLAGRGAGIVLNPYTVRYLTDRQTMAGVDMSIRSRYLRYVNKNGRITHEIEAPYRFASYNSIYAGLLALFGREKYFLNQRVTGFDRKGEIVRVHTAEGRQFTGDLLVCADGIGSEARCWLLGSTPAAYAGYIAWRGIVSAADVSPTTFELLHEAIIYHIGKDEHLLTYPIPVVDSSFGQGKRYVNWLWYRHVPQGEALDAILTDRHGRRRDLSVAPGAVPDRAVAALKAEATTVPDLLRALILRTEQPFIQAIFDYEIPQMSFGRICILGDAAFSARPHTAAGTAKAAEDARQLGRALNEHGNDVPEALKTWEKRQLQLGRSLVRRNREAGTKLQNGTWPIGAPLPFGLYEAGDSEMK